MTSGRPGYRYGAMPPSGRNAIDTDLPEMRLRRETADAKRCLPVLPCLRQLRHAAQAGNRRLLRLLQLRRRSLPAEAGKIAGGRPEKPLTWYNGTDLILKMLGEGHAATDDQSSGKTSRLNVDGRKELEERLNRKEPRPPRLEASAILCY